MTIDRKQRAAPPFLPLPPGEGRGEGNGRNEALAIRRADRFFNRLAGLLFLPPLQPGHGLLLVPCASVHTAFMAYAIDVVFLDRAGRIRRIVPHLKPWRAAAFPCAYQTLELAAGEAARLGLRAGQSLAQGLPASTPEKRA